MVWARTLASSGEWPCRLLIADEVGLGKTILANLILQAILAGCRAHSDPDAEERADPVARLR
jgi:Holliday junction resolvasome RuvABC ATP-dependent DNA helicase subunit